MKWCLYVVRTADDTLYTGISTDVYRRFAEHVSHGAKSAKYFSAHPPAAIAFAAPIGSRSLALKVEYWFKRLSRTRKDACIDAGEFSIDCNSGRICTT